MYQELWARGITNRLSEEVTYSGAVSSGFEVGDTQINIVTSPGMHRSFHILLTCIAVLTCMLLKQLKQIARFGKHFHTYLEYIVLPQYRSAMITLSSNSE